MHFDIQEKEGISILFLTGEFDIFNSNQISETVEEALERFSGNLLLNMQDVEYMDSSALGALIASFKMAKQKGRRMAFSNVEGKLKEIFGFSNMDQVFTFYGSEAEGIAQLSQP